MYTDLERHEGESTMTEFKCFCLNYPLQMQINANSMFYIQTKKLEISHLWSFFDHHDHKNNLKVNNLKR